MAAAWSPPTHHAARGHQHPNSRPVRVWTGFPQRGLRAGKPHVEWRPIFHQLFQTQEQTPISGLGQSGLCGENSTSCPSELARCRTQVSDTVTRPCPHRGASPPMWTRRPAETQTSGGRLLSTPSSLELMGPQASNHLGLAAQGSRWLPRGWGQGLYYWGLSEGGGPGTMCLEREGPNQGCGPLRAAGFGCLRGPGAWPPLSLLWLPHWMFCRDFCQEARHVLTGEGSLPGASAHLPTRQGRQTLTAGRD